MIRANRRRGVITALLAMAALLVQLASPVATAGYLAHGVPASGPAAQPTKSAGDHGHCADAQTRQAPETPSAPVQSVGSSCEHCLGGACFISGCTPAVLSSVDGIVPSRPMSVSLQSFYLPPSCAAELLYRPPIV